MKFETSLLNRIIQNSFIKKSLLYFMVVGVIFFLDRISKILIINHQIKNNIIFVNDYLNLTLVWNTGVGFGLLDFNISLIYHLITLIIFLVLTFIVYLLYIAENYVKYAYLLVLGGALGNFYDRVVYYSVPDFIDFHYNRYHWFTFNVADIFITIGILLLLLNEFKLKK